jgi:hypothetical protein
MPLQRRRELTEQLLVPPDVQESVVSVQFSRKSLRLKGSPHIVHPRGVQCGERFTTPHLEGALEQPCRVRGFGRPGFGYQAAESIQVHSREIRPQHIAAGFACDHHIVDPVEQSSQPGQISRQGVSHAMRRLVGPHAIDELFRRDRPVRVDQQGNQNASLAGMPDLQGISVEQHLDVPE